MCEGNRYATLAMQHTHALQLDSMDYSTNYFNLLLELDAKAIEKVVAM